MKTKIVHWLGAAALFIALPVAQGWAFGTVSNVPFLGQDAEHEKITRAALSMLDSNTLDELAGETGNFGAVGAPDDPIRGLLSTDAAHCDNGDYIDQPPGQTYRQTREEAQERLIGCREWMARHLDRAVQFAGQLKKPDENNAALPCGAFIGRFTGNAKCNMIEELGLVLHAAEDFYSHTNWVDQPADGATGANNPPGLGNTGRAGWLDLRRETPFPQGLISGCFTALPEIAFCNNAGGATPMKHDNINKDKGRIVNGVPGAGTTDRGKINGNFARAVNAAIEDARDKWAHFEERVRRTYGADAETILCAIRSDNYETCLAQVAEQPSADWRFSLEDAAATAGLAEAREMLSDLRRVAEDVKAVAAQLQRSCAAGQATGSRLEADVAAADAELGRLETAQATQNTSTNVAGVRKIVQAAADIADTAGRNVARARGVARQQSEAACKLAARINTATVERPGDMVKELQNTQFAAEQTDSALRMARDELARARTAEQRAQAALAGLTQPSNGGGDRVRARSGEMLAVAKGLADAAASLKAARESQLVPLVDSAKPIFREAGERIDAGAKGEELEILKQIRQAYLPIADADEALARCANIMAATATAMQSRLSTLSERSAKLGVGTTAQVSPREMAAVRDAVSDATASAETAELFLDPIEGLNDNAQNCLRQARASSNKVSVQRNEASASCTKSYPGSVVTTFKSGRPQCGCPSGWSWNLADNACITTQARRSEEQRACRNLPGSVFESIDPADKRAVCACPNGTDWNDRRTACESVVVSDEPDTATNPFADVLANLVTQLAQGNNSSGGGYSAGGNSSSGGGYSVAGDLPRTEDNVVDDWGIYAIGPINDSPEVVHGSKAAILKREGGSFAGLGRDFESVATLIARGGWKIEEIYRASSYEDAHREYEALYAKTKTAPILGRFIPIRDKLVHKYNNPRPVGAPK